MDAARDEWARKFYEAEHKGMQNIWDWDDSGLDDEHPGARERYLCLADVVLASRRAPGLSEEKVETKMEQAMPIRLTPTGARD